MSQREIPPLPTETRQSARGLRSTATDVEAKLWYRLRSGRLGGFKFRRQHPVPPYVADFCCIAGKLIVELDGSQHGEQVTVRDATMLGLGFRVLRFWNHDVLERFDDVLSAILAAAQDPTLTPNPSPTGRGESNCRGQIP